jgi:RecB family exonuclease
MDEPLHLRVNRRDILVQGRIDRIDWDDGQTRFRVIDYKTGKRSAKAGDVLKGGEALQLPVYLYAAAEMLGIPPERGQTQYFFASSKGGFFRHTLEGVDLSSQRATFDEALDTIAEGIDEGYFVPRPEQQCRYCDYRTICDVQIKPIMERKAADPRSARYTAMKGLA